MRQRFSVNLLKSNHLNLLIVLVKKSIIWPSFKIKYEVLYGGDTQQTEFILITQFVLIWLIYNLRKSMKLSGTWGKTVNI